jgi:hypothetical protein
VTSLSDAFCNWDMIHCTPNCRRPLRRWRWRAPRIWTCPGCRTRWTLEDSHWTELMSPTHIRLLEHRLGLSHTEDRHP